jgi:hypothetical protein
MKSVPFNRSYWVVPAKLMAGCYPGAPYKAQAHQNLKGLLAHGIRHVISLMAPDELNWDGTPFASYEYHMRSIAARMGVTVSFDRMPIKDMNIPGRIEMIQILDRIDQCIEEDKAVYVHCWGGRGRTGTVVGCYLARHGFASGQTVLWRIQDLRKNTEDHTESSPETGLQRDMVVSWVEGE